MCLVGFCLGLFVRVDGEGLEDMEKSKVGCGLISGA